MWGKKAMRWQSLPPLFACFTAFLSFCLCIITLLFFKEKKTMRPRFILAKRDAFSYSFLLWEAITPEFVLLLIALGQLLGARAVSQCSSKWDQGNSANLHPQRICLMRFATRHVISLLDSPLADTKFPLRSLPKLLKILQTTSKSPWNGLWAKREKLLCLSPVTYVPLRCPLPPSQLSPVLLQDTRHRAGSSLPSPPHPRQSPLTRHMHWGFPSLITPKAAPMWWRPRHRLTFKFATDPPHEIREDGWALLPVSVAHLQCRHGGLSSHPPSAWCISFWGQRSRFISPSQWDPPDLTSLHKTPFRA